ncbi:MAG: hypothetical protein RBT75_19910 [Anaerolineae bacterium]|jgi:hypothetical protein|nr:hypothetical protein [Anaerolineae bacterium]
MALPELDWANLSAAQKAAIIAQGVKITSASGGQFYIGGDIQGLTSCCQLAIVVFFA